MNGEESEITVEQLQEALETLNLSDSVREIVDIKADVASPEVIYHVCNPVADVQVPDKVYYYASRETVRREIGLRIRKRRQELGLTQDALATMLGYSREALSHYETGRAGVDTGDLPHIAAVLNVPISYFYELAPQSNSSALENLYAALNEHDRQTLTDVAQSLYTRRANAPVPDPRPAPVIHRRQSRKITSAKTEEK